MLQIDLAKFGGEILCQPDAFLCSLGDVKVSNTFDQRARNVIPGVEGENLVTAMLTGPGIVFIQSMPFPRFSQRIARAVTSPNMRDNPKLFMQIAIFFFLVLRCGCFVFILTDI
ncbi:putative mitochondrial biogenesis protein AIM24 [Helianthus annuus]|nr:putative mitochondrial biogenesis protein AIM24 [Helianthus annuus]